MSAALDAADCIKRAAKQYEAFVTAAAILEQIGSLENAFGEGQKAVAAIRLEVADAQMALATVKASVAKAKGEAEKKIKEAEESSATLLAEAKSAAEERMREVGTLALSMKMKAQRESSEMILKLNAQVQEVATRRDGLTNEVANLLEKLAATNAEADAAEARLANIKATIAKMAAA